LRDRLTPEQGAVTRKYSEAILAASDPVTRTIRSPGRSGRG
jgi:hypothetical protein